MNGQPQTCWELSLKLFPGELNTAQRRFAWSETLAHLEYLLQAGRIRKETLGETIGYGI